MKDNQDIKYYYTFPQNNGFVVTTVVDGAEKATKSPQ